MLSAITAYSSTSFLGLPWLLIVQVLGVRLTHDDYEHSSYAAEITAGNEALPAACPGNYGTGPQVLLKQRQRIPDFDDADVEHTRYMMIDFWPETGAEALHCAEWSEADNGLTIQTRCTYIRGDCSLWLRTSGLRAMPTNGPFIALRRDAAVREPGTA